MMLILHLQTDVVSRSGTEGKANVDPKRDGATLDFDGKW